MGLKLSCISHTFGLGTRFAVDALHAVDMEVEVGRRTVVLGRTGSGKSTLLLVASGLIAPTAGEVTVDDVAARRVLSGAEGGVGLVFQAPENQLFAETVLDDVAFGPVNLGHERAAAYERAREALMEVGLDPALYGERSPFALSGGEARRVALAGVLAMRPAYLLLDEPTAGLDARGREAVLSVLERIAANTGIVIVTHDAEEFLVGADDVLVLDGGTTAFYGPIEGLLEQAAPLEAAGLRIPEVIRVLVDARRAGYPVSEITADPIKGARILATALQEGRG